MTNLNKVILGGTAAVSFLLGAICETSIGLNEETLAEKVEAVNPNDITLKEAKRLHSTVNYQVTKATNTKKDLDAKVGPMLKTAGYLPSKTPQLTTQ